MAFAARGYRSKDRYARNSRTSGRRTTARSYDRGYYPAEEYEQYDRGYYPSSSKYDDGFYDPEAVSYDQYRVGYPPKRPAYEVDTSRRDWEYGQQYGGSSRRYQQAVYEDSRGHYYENVHSGHQYWYDNNYDYNNEYNNYRRPEKVRTRDKHDSSARTANREMDDASRMAQYRAPLPLARDEAVVALETQHDKTEKYVIRLLQTRPVVYQFIEQEMYRIYDAVPGLTSIFQSLLSEDGMTAFYQRLPRVMKVEEIYERLCDAIRVKHRSQGVPNIFVLIHNEVVGLHLTRRVYSAEEQHVAGFEKKIKTRLEVAAAVLAKRHWDQWYWKADSSRIEQEKMIHKLPTTQFATTGFLQDFNANYQDVKKKWLNTIVNAWPVPVENGKMYLPTAILWRQKFGWACEFSSDENVKLIRLDVLTDEDRARKKRSRHGKPQQIHFVHLLRLAKTTQVHMSPDEEDPPVPTRTNGEQKAQEVADPQTRHAVVRGNDFARHIRSGRDFWINSTRVSLPVCASEIMEGVIRPGTKVYSFRCCRRVYSKHHADLNGFRCTYCRNYYHYTCKFNVYAKDIVRYRPGTTVCRYWRCQKRKVEDDLRDSLLVGNDDEKDEETTRASKQIIEMILGFMVGDSFIPFPCSICNEKTFVPGNCPDCDSCYLCVDSNPQHYFNCEMCGKRTCKLGSFVYGKKCPKCFESTK